MTTIIPPVSAVQSIMDHVPIGVVAFNADLMVVGASRHAKAMLDFSARELMGVTLHDAIANALGEDAARNVRIHATSVITSGHPTPWSSCRLSAGSGQRFVDWEIRPIAIGDGAGVLLTLIDVTEREQAKMQIAATDKSLRLFSEAVLDHALIMTDVRGRITDCNHGAQLLTGFGKDDLVGKAIALLYSQDEVASGVPELEWRSAATHGSISHKRWHERPDGTRYFADGTITAHSLPDELPCFTVAFRDTTAAVLHAEERERVSSERKLTIDALTSVNADLQQFAMVASHDMQEPLRMVSGYLSMLRTRYAGTLDDRAKEYIEFAIDGAQRMARLIRSLLDIARIDHGDIHPCEVSADAAFDEAMANLRQMVISTKATVERRSLGTVVADKDMLIRLFQNLIGNALKYVAEGDTPQVLVDVVEHPDERVFLVKDHGLGVSPQDQTRIFDAFERVHGRGDYGGTGLGLAICRGIVQRHGGRLSLESREGHGATFMFSLPRNGPPTAVSVPPTVAR